MASPLAGSIRKTVGKAFKKLFLDAVITRETTTGGDPWDPTSTSTETFSGKGIFEEYGVGYRRDGLVQTGDMKALLLAASFSTDPLPGDKITIDGKTLTIVPADSGGQPAVQTDPAKATWTCRCRA